MRRQSLYILIVALCFGLGILAQPAHATACLAQSMHLPVNQPQHSHSGHGHDHHKGHPNGGNNHNCLCLQWCMGLDGACFSELVKALAPSADQITEIGLPLASIVSLVDPTDKAPGIPDGNLILPLQCPLYLQIHALLC